MAETYTNWVGVPRNVFAPAAAEGRAEHLAVLACFHDAVFEPALNLEALSNRLRDTAPELADDDTHLTQILRQLTAAWGLLEESRDESVTYNDPTEFARRHIQWSLTDHGQATLAALDAAFDQLRTAAALQPAAIDAIAAALGDVADWLDGVDGPVDDDVAAQVHISLFNAEGHHRSLIDNLRTFTRDVTRALTRPDLDDVDLADAKHHIVNYLDRYVVGSDAPARRVADAMSRLDAIGFDTVAEVAARGQNLAPGIDGTDPTPAAAAQRREHLDALARWFSTSADTAPLFAGLLPRGRDAVLSFLRVLGIRREIARRNASLPEDFRSLARAFRGATDTDAARLWGAATGLTPARHHHLAADDTGHAPSRGNPAAANPGVDLVVELRRRPRSTGRPAGARPVPDSSGARAAAQASHAATLAAQQRRRAALATDGAVRLSTFTDLDTDHFDAFCDLLAAALVATTDAHGRRSARTPDGRVQVELGSLDEHARTHTATVRTTRGALHGPDLTVDIAVIGATRTAAAATGTDA